jgi:hypothetical protein
VHLCSVLGLFDVRLVREAPETLEEIADRLERRTDLAPRLRPMNFGKAVYQPAIEFWRRLGKSPTAALSTRSMTQQGALTGPSCATTGP